MNRIEQSIYLELLRASLWERTPDLTVFHGEWSWTALFDAYKNHDQLGVVANTIALLPESIKPNEQEMNVVYQYVGSLIKSHYLLNTRLCDIMPQLEAAGCHPVLLKGQGLSTLYPKTCLRSCGDLDIYVGEENMDKAKAVVNAMATKEEIEQALDSKYHYHYGIEINGVEYEIHRTPGNTTIKCYQDVFLDKSRQYLHHEQFESAMLPIGCNTININVPPINFNLWYVFDHMMRHFRKTGTGYRHFCDWLMVLREWNKRFNNPELKKNRYSEIQNLEEILCSIGLLRAWKILGGILVYQLGLPETEFPLFDAHMAKKSQGYVADCIMRSKHFHFASYDELRGNGSKLRRIFAVLYLYYSYSRPLFVISSWYPYISFSRHLYGFGRGFVKRHIK